jgi:Glucodextranase, domain B
LPLSVITNGTTVQFLMESNLMLQANFVDVTRPTLTIKSPTSGQTMTNALATIIGTATDNWQVSSVWYQLNGGVWNPGMTTDGYTNWTSPLLTLVAGTNSVNAYALDLAGNMSTTNHVSFVSSNTFMLQLNFALTPPLTSTGLNFSLQLSPELNGHVQVSTNLMDWAALTNFVGATNTTLNFLDPAATNSSQRFYRAVIP